MISFTFILCQTTTSRLVQIEAICRPQTKCNLKPEIPFMMGKIVGKGENAGYQQFLTMFSKGFFFGVVNSRIVW